MPPKVAILPRAAGMFPKSSNLIRLDQAYHPDKDSGSGSHSDGWEPVSRFLTSGDNYATRVNVEKLEAAGFTKVSLNGTGAVSFRDAEIADLLHR